MTKLQEQLTGQRVTHTHPDGTAGSYGKGTIREIAETNGCIRVKVYFDDIDSVKTFIYPDCFGKFLKPEDPALEERLAELKAILTVTKKISAQSTPEKSEEANAVLAELDALIGLDEVKSDVHRLTDFMRVNNLRKERGLKSVVVSKHLVLTGNPGTGKTTVARMIARIYYSIGAVSKNKFVETNRAGLVGGYLGQTALKTKAVIDSALGGVLFIDEAYSLVNSNERDCYGKEAIETLITAMENERNNLVVIVAGYEEEMKRFIDSNPGLSSRFNRYLTFRDYTADELLSIFRKLCDDNDYTLPDKTENLLRTRLECLYANRSKDFGNARTVRNIFEGIITHQAERIMRMEPVDVDDRTLAELTAEDVENTLPQSA